MSSGSIRGRPHGGVGVLWHKSLDSFVSVLDLHSEWACGINVSLQGDTVCILSVYLPYECDENQDDYIRALEELKVLVDESVTPLIFILGDYNTDILKQSTFSRYIEQFLSESNLLLSDSLFLDTGYTYVSDAWGTTSWLDHCICTETSHSCIVDIDIHYGYVTSDKVQQNAKTLTPATIGEAKGTLAITKMWAEHFQSVLASDATCSHDMKTFIEDNNVILYSPDMCVTSDEICDAVNYLKFGKSSGLDEIFAEHIVAAGEHVIEPLRMLMSAMLIHGYMPEKLMNGVIIPVTKNRNKSISDKQNYRPISLSNIISKIFECILLKKLQPYIGTCVNQFGYKPNSGTELCIFTLKEYLNYYQKLGSHIFTCFMDASAAFDRIKFIKLFKKLKKRKTPLYLIRVLSYWYINQKLCVRWCSQLSSMFSVTNGVRQGGILSPYLFNLYMDDLSCSLNKLKIGLCINSQVINHMMYADDLVLLSPSVKGLQKVIDLCFNYGNDHRIKFNKTKTVCLHVQSQYKKYRWIGKSPALYLGTKLLSVVEHVMYLGHVIHNSLSDDLDIQRQTRLLYYKANTLAKKFHMCSEYIKTYLFKMYCTTIYIVAVCGRGTLLEQLRNLKLLITIVTEFS